MLVRLVGNGIQEWQRKFYSSKSFLRRVKRTVRAPRHLFEVIVPPQWRNICRDEIASLGCEILENEDDGDMALSKSESSPSSKVITRGRIWDAYRLCLWLRTASRVVVRISSFNARSLQVFRKAMESVPWEVWLSPLFVIRLYCNVEYSELRHEGLVSDETVKAICRRFESQGLRLSSEIIKDSEEHQADELTSPKIRLWVNLIRNVCMVGLDLTGTHLHERGYRLEPGHAPMRETLAAAILKFMKWDPSGESLVDGMTGSGTIAIEAALMARNIAPGLKRSFLFEQLPFFDDAPWRYEKKLAESSIKTPSCPIVALDIDSEQLNLARRNASRAGVESDIRWIRGDFFLSTPETLGLSTGVLFLNPPYGKRLTVSTRRLFGQIREHLTRYYNGWRVGLIVPEKSLVSLFSSFDPSLFKLPHGGLWVNLAVFKV